MMDSLRTLGVGALLAGLLLAGCAVPQWQKPGTPLAQIEQGMGQPTRSVALPDGGQRLIYSYQPSGQQVWQMQFDAAQRLVSATQVLTVEQFQKLRPGVDTRASVLDTFGPPALVEGVASFEGDVWTYRILENNIPRLASVHIDPRGIVQRVVFTDEIRADADPKR
ncbi:MAG: hypothetical protein OZ923_04130 [Comamonadaceae bacterium]|nr:outer membrane protein assembly factor BamE [Burkholderiales bacterium]MEB2347779.1 hypothetical protein [Comamonadaceae bacterium]